jgi:hypothetical protein
MPHWLTNCNKSQYVWLAVQNNDAATHLDNLLFRCLALGPVLFLAYLGKEHGYLCINE